MCAMQIPILIEPIEGARFRAREPFGLTAEADTADAAARVLEVYIRQRLDAGSHLTFLDLGNAAPARPPHAFYLPPVPEDDWAFREMREAIAENRRREDEEERLKDEPLSP